MIDHVIATLDGANITSKKQMTLIAVMSFLLVGILFGANLFAKWWIIDDHEIMWFIGENEHLSANQLFPLLGQTEVGRYGETARFRPTYYFLRLSEAIIWGKHPMFWYGFRLWIAFFFTSSFWYMMSRRVGFVAAGLLAAYTMTFTYWIDIFGKLGPGELYAIFGVALFTIGFDAVYQSISELSGWVLMLVGLIIASGAKENFILFLLPEMFLLGWMIWQRKRYIVPYVITLLSFLWCSWIVGAILTYTSKTGRDVYAQSTSPTSRLRILLQIHPHSDLLPLYLLCFILFILWLYFHKRRPEIAVISIWALGCVIMLLGLYFSQIIFYNGSWPTDTRYDFPGMLYLPLTFGLVIWYMRQVVQHLDEAIMPYQQVTVLTVSVLICLALVVSHKGEARQIIKSSLANLHRTENFTGKLKKLADISREFPDYALVIQTDNVWDFEPVYSYPRFLTAYSVDNPRFLCWAGTPSADASDLEKELATGLGKLSSVGAPEFYQSQSELGAFGNHCIAVVLSGTPKCNCSIQFNGKWR